MVRLLGLWVVAAMWVLPVVIANADTRPPWASPPDKPQEEDRIKDEQVLDVLPGTPGNEIDVQGRETAASQLLPLGYTGLKGLRGPPGPPGGTSYPVCLGEGCPDDTDPPDCSTCTDCDLECGGDPDEVFEDPPEIGSGRALCTRLGRLGVPSSYHVVYGDHGGAGNLCRAEQGLVEPVDLGGTEAECTAAGGVIVGTGNGCPICRFGAASVDTSVAYVARKIVWYIGRGWRGTEQPGTHCDHEFSVADGPSCGLSLSSNAPRVLAPVAVDCPSGWRQLDHWGATAATFVDSRRSARHDPDAVCVSGQSFMNSPVAMDGEMDHSERLLGSDTYRCCFGKAYRYQVGCLKVLDSG